MNNESRSFIGPRTSACMLAGMACLLLAACDPTPDGTQTTRLSPCSASGSVFEDLPFERWATVYHAATAEAITEHMEAFGETETKALQCASPDGSGSLPAGSKLEEVASSLVDWKDTEITQFELVPVLQDFLRIYECSMHERLRFHEVAVMQKLQRLAEEVAQQTGQPVERITRGDLEAAITRERRIMEQELAIARPALERTLILLGGFDRLGPLTMQMECMTRASLDLRNVIGLTTDLAACLPRVWDAHGSLRDLLEPTEN